MRRDALEHADEAENFEALCDGYEARISQLEADNAALMEVVRAGLAMRIFTASGKDAFRAALSALPAHLKQEASK